MLMMTVMMVVGTGAGMQLQFAVNKCVHQVFGRGNRCSGIGRYVLLVKQIDGFLSHSSGNPGVTLRYHLIQKMSKL